ncbi:MAG: PIG-L family deacetylase [Candidatus Marinimicrobia bacterium]|nr:PIG-L family deacetylase [Candidatus Neomarinimicrobiota bacterium]MCF7829832.1 PIG-L family deacetylase [Candidatus Neomarinimicrobiota bacterium]MCF7881735.1 PIG-L family deacetylase [Candidatus Neomarinimicrobiota bacterium]MCF8232842.1 PIG-L family deacetylase [Bacteroidales bacterium]
MKTLPFTKVLALSPHTDDIEFGCGGTLSRLLEQGAEVHTAIFSLCQESVPEGFPDDVLLHEMHASADVLGIPQKNRHIFNYPVRRFPEHRQDILEDLVQLKKDLQPDLVLTPSTDDVHQDHEVISKESIRAFRFSSLWGYELPWNNLSFQNQAVVGLNEKYLEQKTEALSCYKSQGFRPYSDPEFFRAIARSRGMQNKRDLVEVFELIKLVL